MYTIENLLENYRKNEAAEGALLALSGKITYQTQKEKSAAGKLLSLQAEIPVKGRRGLPQTLNTTVTIDEIHGELVECRCDCSEFEEDSYACRHTVALQVKWLLDQLGRDAFRNSPLHGLLAEKTGIQDPFIPGVLRETSDSLQSLMKEAALKNQLPVAAANGPAQLHLEIHLVNRGQTNLELKVGEKRSYVVKDARDFLNAFQSRRELTFGKNFRFFAGEELFGKEDRKVLNYLCALAADDERDPMQRSLFCSGYGSNTPRYMHLTGMEFDHLMEQSEKTGIYMDDKKRFFSPEEYRPALRLKKQEYGALLEFEQVAEVASTADWKYLLAGGEIRRIAQDKNGDTDKIIDLAEKKEELYISEKDLPGVLSTMLPPLMQRLEVTAEGMELAPYLPRKPRFRWYLDYPQEDMISCRAQACYEEDVFSLGRDFKPGQRRNQEAEQEMLIKLQPIFHAYEKETESFFYQGGEGEIYYFLTELLPRLEELGEVFISDKLKKLNVRPLSKVQVGISVESGLLELSLTSEEFTREELIDILSSFKSKKKYYKLKKGGFLKVDEEQEALWLELSKCLKGCRKPTDSQWKLPLFRAMYLDEMMADRDSVDYSRSREYRRLLGRMREAQNNSYEPPKSLDGILRGYQADGFRWLKTLKQNGFGGILADDMGLGKTLQILAFLLSEKEEGKSGDALRTLIVTPASLLYNWKQEIERYTPELKVQVIAGSVQERQELLAGEAGDSEIWLTSYDLLKRDIPWYENIVFANEILDEAQYIKNQTTQASGAVRLIQSGFRMALTGTPIENRLSELWSIFDYLMPGFLYNYSRFRDELEAPVMNQDEEAMERIRRMVHPFILRRMKKEVLKELPDKLEEEITVSMGKEQKRLYDAHVQRLKMYLAKQTPEEFAQGKLEILAELTKLRRLCCGPELLIEDYKGENAKLETCMELVHQAIEGGHKVLLFSQFTSMLDLIGSRLKEDAIAYYRIDGSVSKEERIRRVDAFGQDDTPVFCISLKAGGTGLNLTAADIVIHYDPWWNLAAQNQATDRAHRIGQTHVVTVYQLTASGTIEEKILELQKSKYKLAEDVLSGEGISSILVDQEQVLSLLAD